MTIKEAFEKLHKAVKKAGLNPFFLIGNLKDTFKDVAANVEEGTNVEVVPAQSSGYLVGNVKVNGEDNYLFAPPQVPPLDIYSTEERLVGVFFHNGISEDVYERSIVVNNITLGNNERASILAASNMKLFKAFGYLAEGGTIYAVPDTGLRIMMESQSVYLMSINSSWYQVNGVITIQYTKTNS